MRCENEQDKQFVTARSIWRFAITWPEEKCSAWVPRIRHTSPAKYTCTELAAWSVDQDESQVLDWGINNKLWFGLTTRRQQAGRHIICPLFALEHCHVDQAISPWYEVRDIIIVLYPELASSLGFGLMSTWCPAKCGWQGTGFILSTERWVERIQKLIGFGLLLDANNCRRCRKAVKFCLRNLKIDKIRSLKPHPFVWVPELSALWYGIRHLNQQWHTNRHIYVPTLPIKWQNHLYSHSGTKSHQSVLQNYVIVDMLKYVAEVIGKKNIKVRLQERLGTTNSYKDMAGM